MLGVSQISANTKLHVLAALYVFTYAEHEHYVGWKSYYVNASTPKQVRNLNDIRTRLDLDFLSAAHVKREALVLVKPEHQEEFINTLENLGITYRTHANDVKSVLDGEDEANKNWAKSIARDGGHILSYNNYERLHKINAYMEYIATKYSKTTTLVTAANSFEGRPIRYLLISISDFQVKTKPVIFIEGGMHSREWISPPTVTWAIKKLTENVTEPDLLYHFDWILMPVANPDGYDFSFTAKRLWRKNRSRTLPNNHFCPGVDGNRNFDIAWNTAGTQSDPCSHIFPGIHSFSEIETQVIRDILKRYLPRIALYVSVHSYGGFILHPWGHNHTHSYNHDALNSVGVAMADAFLKAAPKNFSRLLVGTTEKILYKCSGTSADYAHHIGVPLAFTFELPGLEPARYQRFHMDPQYIRNVCHAAWTGIIVGAKRARMMVKLD